MSNKVVTNIAKEFAEKMASVKEAFILQELKPYYTYSSIDGIQWTQKVHLRLAEYGDFERRFKWEKENLQHKLIEDISNKRGEVVFKDDIINIINKRFEGDE